MANPIPPKSILVVGYGSIGARHARLFSSLGHDVAVVSRRNNVEWECAFESIQAALESRQVDHAVVANETAEHLRAAEELRIRGFDGPILIEKPLSSEVPGSAQAASVGTGPVWVAYNLRFHPALQRLRSRLAGQHIINACIYVGQDLRTWRPARNLHQSYSASRASGGGVLRDLSHELDYMLWLLGDWNHVTALGGHLGPLPIEADDSWNILLNLERCPAASVQLNYYNRPATRFLIINTATETIKVDLIAHTYTDGDGEVRWELDGDATYLAQLENFLGEGLQQDLCSLEEGIHTMKLIEAIEMAAANRSWVAA